MPLNLKKVTYKPFDYDLSTEENYQYVELAKCSNGDTKVLFVLDYMPTEDLDSGKLLSGFTGKLLENIITKVSEPYAGKRFNFSWCAITFNAYKTVHLSEDNKEKANAEFKARILNMLDRYKPDVVVAFGQAPIRALIPDQLSKTDGKIGGWLGVPVKAHNTIVVPTLSLNFKKGDEVLSSLLGYVGRNLANALSGKNLYQVDNKKLKNIKLHFIDSIKKFDRLLEIIENAPIVAIDTETENLNKIVNTLLTIQFAVDTEKAFILPLCHKDTPFDPDELRYIKKKLRQYFESKNKNKYQIYANAMFDLAQFRSQLGVRFFKANVYDIFAGEYCLDENLKSLITAGFNWYYSLGNISLQYGFTGYIEAAFSKSDRHTIKNVDLNEDVLRYCGWDTCVPFAIHLKQIEKNKNNLKFLSTVSEQLSDMLHLFSKMENTGNLIDVDYLFYLKSPDSPIESEIRKIKQKLLSSEAVLEANRMLAKGKSASTKDLWGSKVVYNIFNLRKNEHKEMLFFKVLELQPISLGKSGKGKLDKAFQKHYKDVPEVEMYSNLQKGLKLKNAYVNNFIDLLKTDEDLKNDNRIRPTFQYLPVVTGRASEKDPNLQQVPSHSALGKHIKRLFIAKIGCLYIKVDYRVHEVRGWGLISYDEGVANVFLAAKKLRDDYRLHPTKELQQKVKTEADVHRINAVYFFGLTMKQVLENPEHRNAVKSVIFGLIYQMAVSTLANNLGKSLEYTENLVKGFIKRFPKAMRWIEETKKFAKKNLYVENMLGMRRHLWSYVLPDDKIANSVKSRSDRQGVNSPIQGMCSQFMSIGGRVLDKTIWKLSKEKKRPFELEIQNTVHDSLETVASYRDLIKSLAIIEESLITKVREIVKERHGKDFVVDLEIDFELGPSLDKCQGWDFSLEQLNEILYDSLVFQRDNLKYDVDVDEALTEIFSTFKEDAPWWMRKQAKNLGWKPKGSKYWIKKKEEEARLKLEKEQAEIKTKKKEKIKSVK